MHEDIIGCVLDMPEIYPDSWEVWWDIWNSNSAYMKKTVVNHNSGGSGWKGIEIYRGPTYTEDKTYDVRYVDCRHIFPNMIGTIESLPMKINVVRALQSLRPYPPHHDFVLPQVQCRVLLYDENPSNTFYYIIDGKKVFQKLPEESNTWIYKDEGLLHGSDYNPKYKKILLGIFGHWLHDEDSCLISGSIDRYREYVISS